MRGERRPLLLLGAAVIVLVGIRAVSMVVVAQPGYTDAYYFASVAARLAHGDGLTADFIWNYLEAPRFAVLPVPSHRFWMPLPTVVQAAGIVLGGGALGDFRAGQLAIVAVAAAVPLAAYAAARSLGSTVRSALLATGVVGLGGALAPAWVSLDAFAIAALLGTGFLVAFPAASRGSLRGGIACGLLVGLLYLTRAEGALFGLPLLWLIRSRTSRGAGLGGSLVALGIGTSWLVRNALLSFPDDLLARAVLPVRYEDFFALQPPTVDAFVAAWPTVLAAKAAALVTNALTAVMAVLIVLIVPLAAAARRRWDRPEVRAFAALALAVYLVQSLVFTVHSVRGSYFHSVAAFFPFAVALAAAGTDDLFAAAGARMQRTVAAAALVAFGVVSAFSLAQWDVDFNTPYRDRAAAAASLPAGPLVVTDAAAWRWITGRPAVLAAADGPSSAACAAQAYAATTLVLEPAHFSRYDDLYGSRRTDLFTWRGDQGPIRFFALREGQRCVIADRP